MLITPESAELIRSMLKEGFNLLLRVTSYPDDEDGVESGSVLFSLREWEDPRGRVVGDLYEFLDAYSGNHGCDLNDLIRIAADNARQAKREGLTKSYQLDA